MLKQRIKNNAFIEYENTKSYVRKGKETTVGNMGFQIRSVKSNFQHFWFDCYSPTSFPLDINSHSYPIKFFCKVKSWITFYRPTFISLKHFSSFLLKVTVVIWIFRFLVELLILSFQYLWGFVYLLEYRVNCFMFSQ